MHVAVTRDSWPSETSMWRVQLQWIIYLNKLRSEVLTSLHESVDVFTFRCRIQYWCSVRNVRVTHLNAIELHNFVLWLPLKSDRNAVVPAGYGCKKCTHWNGWRQWRRGCHHHKAFDISDVFSSCLQNKISILGLQVSRVIRVAGWLMSSGGSSVNGLAALNIKLTKTFWPKNAATITKNFATVRVLTFVTRKHLLFTQ